MKNWFFKPSSIHLLMVLSVFFVIPALWLQGTDLKPWYPSSLQVNGEVDYRFQYYPCVDAPHCQPHYSSTDHFLEGSLLFVFDPLSVQMEGEWADTKKRSFDWDHVSLTARYLWLDDNLGDSVSLTTGVTLSRAWREAVNDISSFHHGRNELFLHAALGKQSLQEAFWKTGWWGVIGIGTADRWTPWIVANANYEWNSLSAHRLNLYVNSLWGCGSKKINICRFGGYGPVDHRSIDIGLKYTYVFDYCGYLSFEYARRVYAHNFPDQANQFKISYIYPFGPEGDYFLLKAYSLFFETPSFL